MSMTIHEAVRVIAAMSQDALAVVTMGSMNAMKEVRPGPLNLSSVPMMGGASSLGLGLALGAPERQVFVLDGDGSLLMQLGSLVTIAKQAPPNLYHFVLDNGIWYYRGGLIPHPGNGIADFGALARAAGYKQTWSIENAIDLRTELPSILSVAGPSLIRLTISHDNIRPWSSSNPQDEIPDSQFTRMGEEARTMKQALM